MAAPKNPWRGARKRRRGERTTASPCEEPLENSCGTIRPSYAQRGREARCVCPGSLGRALSSSEACQRPDVPPCRSQIDLPGTLRYDGCLCSYAWFPERSEERRVGKECRSRW